MILLKNGLMRAIIQFEHKSHRRKLFGLYICTCIVKSVLKALTVDYNIHKTMKIYKYSQDKEIAISINISNMIMILVISM